MRKILITGHKGFIGSALVENLKENNEIFTFEKRITPLTVLPKVDWIYHMAASSGGINYIKEEAQKVVMNNFTLDRIVLEHCLNGGASKLFYPSSACIYPEYRQQGVKETLQEHLAWPALPDTMYGLQKLYMESLLEMVKDKFEVKIGRLFSVYGPGAPYLGDKAKFIPALIRKLIISLKTDENLEIWGDGKPKRSIIYIDDAVNAINTVMEHANNADPINIATRSGSVAYIYEDIIRALKIKKFT